MLSVPPRAGLRDGSWYQTFHDLMPFRVREVLLVSSSYDAFILEEDGRLSERIFTEYSELNLSAAPRITHVSTGARAMQLMAERRFDLVVAMVRITDTNVSAFGRRVKNEYPDLPIVLLVLTEGDLHMFPGGVDGSVIDEVFWWTGDARIMLAIIKTVEDRANIDQDRRAGVRSIILVEDSVRRYSSFLSVLYGELMKQSESLVAEGFNDLHRLMRMRARPKVLLAKTFERAVELYENYFDSVIALISDVRFPRGGEEDPKAGFALVALARSMNPEIAILLQSAEPENARLAEALGVFYVDKSSTSLLKAIQSFVTESLGFGDFVFRLPDRTEVGRARHAYELEQTLRVVPIASVVYHATRNHFSLWLQARSMFEVAAELRPRAPGDFADPEDLREFIIEVLRDNRMREQEGAITDFSTRSVTSPKTQFVRLGKGSVGGKGRGLAFVSSLITRTGIAEKFPDLEIRIPNSIVVPTDEFDKFVEQNRVLASRGSHPDEHVTQARCMAGRISDEMKHRLRRAVATLRGPLAVRSSSMLEDSQLQPFAGVYATHMIPNVHPDPDVRFHDLCHAIRAVYASTFSDEARAYIASTPYSIEEEKMAVLIQEVVGQQYGPRFYPHAAGVAVSYNYYPIGHQRAEDGLVLMALGLGQTIVQGGAALQFSPRDPGILPQFGSAADYLRYSQRKFYAIDLDGRSNTTGLVEGTRPYDLSVAEQDGTLALAGSVYSTDDDVIRDNLTERGPRVVTFHNILKWGALPVPAALSALLDLFREGMGCPVEMEFALDAGDYGRLRHNDEPRREPALYVLQVRPQAITAFDAQVETEGFAEEQILCRTDRSLGHGRIEGVRDILYVKRKNLQATETSAVAEQVGELNAKLLLERRPYLLVGPGRWGSSDPSLGIPVKWAQITGARVIVETVFDDRDVEPSQGAHFFHNVTSFRIGYLTLSNVDRRGTVGSRSFDFPWLESLPAAYETSEVRAVRLEEPLHILLDGRAGRATILKP